MARVQLYGDAKVQAAQPAEAGFHAANFNASLEDGLKAIATVPEREAQVDVLEAERQRQIDRTALTASYFDTAGELTTRVLHARENLAEGAAGHVDQVRTAVNEVTAPFLSNIRDPVLRREFEGRVAQLRAQTVATEEGYASTKRQESLGANTLRAVDTASNGITVNPTPENLQHTRETLLGLVDNASDIPQETRNELRQRINSSTAVAYLTGLDEGGNSQAALETLRSGVFNADLTPEQTRVLTDRFQSSVRQHEAEVRRQQAAARTQVEQEVQILDRRFADGDPTLTDADIAAVQQHASAAGIPTEVYDASRYRVRLNTQRQYRNATPIEINQAITQLDQRIGAAGDHARPDDVIARAELQTMQTARTQQVQGNPLGALAQTGIAVEPVDSSNPGSVRARVTAARTAERRFGFFQFYTPQEAAQLQATAGSGPNGRLQVVNEIAAIGAVDRDAAERAAQQIAPNDRVFRYAIRLNPMRRAYVLQGADSLRALNQNLRVNGQNVTFENVSAQWFQRNIAPQLRLQNPELQNDILATARAYYAEVSRRNGDSGRTDFNESNFAEAVSVALGTNGGRGGTGYWSYGPRTAEGGSYGTVLPSRMNQGEFDRVMTYLPLARLNEQWPRGSTNGTARWPSGQNMSADDIRGRFIPIMVSDGVYEFHAPDGSGVLNERGQPWRLDVYALQTAAPDRARTRRNQPARQIPVRASDRRERTLSGRD